ncbi:hypothetical protein FHR32_007052 [Streptosporangium album]|uniref:Transposase IS4-like domain-containing protein n=1 Tax=Streptosporangium album TaxID=47479 RepID=A0A7W7S2H7_9ACTN|nr:hypothetical protein [Streptosporangium album]MBB4942666.1 hypothetical protein [Streptosporangium album]
MVLTLDALHTTKATARLITEQLGGHYVLILKGNQPLARAAARALLPGPDAEWSDTTAIDHDHGHDRTERRTIRTTEADEGLFPGARQAFRLRRDVGDLDGTWTGKEIVYGITSLPAALAERQSHPVPFIARTSEPERESTPWTIMMTSDDTAAARTVSHHSINRLRSTRCEDPRLEPRKGDSGPVT